MENGKVDENESRALVKLVKCAYITSNRRIIYWNLKEWKISVLVLICVFQMNFHCFCSSIFLVILFFGSNSIKSDVLYVFGPWFFVVLQSLSKILENLTYNRQIDEKIDETRIESRRNHWNALKSQQIEKLSNEIQNNGKKNEK